jgi:hypothetical protein
MTVQMTVQSTDIDVELGGLKYGHAMPEKKHAKTEKGVAGTMLQPFGWFAPMTRRACWKSSVRRSSGKIEMATPKSCGSQLSHASPRRPDAASSGLKWHSGRRSAVVRTDMREPFPNGESMTKVSKGLQVTTFAVGCSKCSRLGG